jgi:hypothetical protein
VRVTECGCACVERACVSGGVTLWWPRWWSSWHGSDDRGNGRVVAVAVVVVVAIVAVAYVAAVTVLHHHTSSNDGLASLLSFATG